jgi:hypothetical protein
VSAFQTGIVALAIRVLLFAAKNLIVVATIAVTP